MATQLRGKWIQDLAITNAKIDATAISVDKLATSMVGQGLQIDGTSLAIRADGTSIIVTPNGIRVGTALDSSNIADGAVSRDKIAAGAINTVKLDTTAVTRDKIAGLAVNTDKLDTTSVTSAKLGDVAGDGLTGGSGFDLAVLADGTTIKVTSSGIKVDRTSITAAELGAVAGSGLTGGVGTPVAVLADGTTIDVSGSGIKLADAAVTTGKIAAQAVTSEKLGDVAGNGLTGGSGSDLAVQADGTSITVGGSGIKVTASGIDEAMLANGAVTATKIAAGAVTRDKIADSAINEAKLDATSVSAAKLGAVAGNGLTGGNGSAVAALADGTSLTVTASGIKVTASGIDEAMLANGSVTASKISSTAVGNGLQGGDGTSLSVKADSTTITVGASGIKVTNGAIGVNQIGSDIAGAGLAGGSGSPLSVNVDGSSIAISVDTLTIPAGGVTNTLLAGSITDDKLNQITTTNKVAASAVEDKFIRNDSDDTSTGRIQANGFDANSYQISRLADGTSNSDAVNLGQLNQAVASGRIWKEALLYSGQLINGGTGGIAAANVVALSANLQAGDTISLAVDSTTENYVAGTDFAVGGTISATLANLSAVINPASIAASATTGLLDSIDSTNDVLIIWQDTIGSTIRIYGDAAAAGRANVLPVAKLYGGVAADLVALATSDPTTTNFGFSRLEASLFEGETHLARENDSAYTWDGDSTAWVQSGASSIPYASKTTYGKVQISDGISVSSGIIAVQADGTTLTVGTNGVKVTAAGITATELAAGSVIRDKIVDGSINAAKIDATAVSASKLGAVAGNGLTGGNGSAVAALADGTSLTVTASGIKVTASGIDAAMVADGAVVRDKIADGAVNAAKIDATAVSAAKLGAVAGNGLTGGNGSVVAVLADGTTIKVTASGIKVDATSITAVELGAVAGDGLTGGNGALVAVLADGTSLGVSASGVKIADAGVTAGKIATAAVGYDKLYLDTTSGLTSDGTNAIKVQVKVGGGIVLDGSGLSIDPVSVNTYRMEQHTLTSGEISGKSFQLAAIPSDSSQVSFEVLHGMTQIYAVDYVVTDTTVGWTGLGLDGFLDAGEVVQVCYPVALLVP